MKIRMKTAVSGSRNGQPWPPRGGTLELPDGEGAALCASGLAEPVADDVDASVETAIPEGDAEKRALTTQTAAAVTPNAPAAEAEPPMPVKKAAPARKAAAKKTAAAPAKD
ncbi:hypothetical protein ACWD5V_09495 [Streptomyces sp. NPDC002523]